MLYCFVDFLIGAGYACGVTHKITRVALTALTLLSTKVLPPRQSMTFGEI